MIYLNNSCKSIADDSMFVLNLVHVQSQKVQAILTREAL